MEDRENNGTRNFLKAPGIATFFQEVLCRTENAINYARNNNLIKDKKINYEGCLKRAWTIWLFLFKQVYIDISYTCTELFVLKFQIKLECF